MLEINGHIVLRVMISWTSCYIIETGALLGKHLKRSRIHLLIPVGVQGQNEDTLFGSNMFTT